LGAVGHLSMETRRAGGGVAMAVGSRGKQLESWGRGEIGDRQS